MSVNKKVLLVDCPVAPKLLYDDRTKEIMYVKKAIEFYLDFRGGRNMLERKIKKSYTLGLLTIGAYLKEHGIEVEYISFPFDYGRFEDLLKNKDYALFTAMTPIYPYVRPLIQKAKEFNPGITTIFGGYHATALPAQILVEEPALDYVIVGEGEKPTLNLILSSGESDDLPGVISRSNMSKNRFKKFDLLTADEIPNADYSLLPGDKFEYRFNIQNTRGCPERCLYCQNGFFWKKVRTRPIDKIVKELLEIQSIFQPNFELHITDNIFTLDRKFLNDFKNAYYDNGVKLNFSCDIKAEYIDEEVVKLMDVINVKKAWMGFEDSSDLILVDSGRKNSFENNTKALKIIKEHSDIKVQGYWMLGLPGTTAESIQYNIDCIKYLLDEGLLEGISSDSLFVPLPGTPMYDMATLYGIKILDNDWLNYHRSQFFPVFETEQLSRTDLRDLLIYFEEEVITLQLKKYNMSRKDIIAHYESLLSKVLDDESVILEKRIF